MPNNNITNLQLRAVSQLVPAKRTEEHTFRLTALLPEIISQQPTINIAIIGQTYQERSKLVEAISKANVEKRCSEEEPNTSPSPFGFTNVKIFKCPKCLGPDCYKSYPTDQEDDPDCYNPGCKATLKLLRNVSFIDHLSHDAHMATMLAGTDNIDAVILLVDPNVPFSQSQTSEHLAAIEMMNLRDKTIVLINRSETLMDNDNEALKKFQEVKTYVQGAIAENSPIIPVSTQFKYNLDSVYQYICEYLPVSDRYNSSAPEMKIMRSFDDNKPDTDFDDLKGGMVKVNILKGTLKVGDKVEIRPGYIVRDDDNRISHYVPIVSKVVSLSTDNNQQLSSALPGGLVNVELSVDPSFTRFNQLAENRMGHANQMPEEPVYQEIEISYYQLRTLLGAKDKVEKIKRGEFLMINVGSGSTGGRVGSVDGERIKISLIVRPVCAKIGDRVAISRKMGHVWRLIGLGALEDGKTLEARSF